jgi:hypothetical protein
MMRALDSAIGFPSRPTSASSMLGLLIPEEVRSSFTGLLGWLLRARTFYALRDPHASRLADHRKLIGLGADPASQPQGR